LRIAVVGSSVGYFVRPHGTRLDQGPYSGQATDLLADAGVPVSVVNRCRWLGEIHDGYSRIEEDVFATSPDVVVMNFGWIECQPKLFPTAVLRWSTTYRPRLNPRTFGVRRWTTRQLGTVYKRATPWVASRWEGLPSRMPESRFATELERYIRTVRRELHSLVVVLNVNPTTDRLEAVLPMVNARAARYSGIIEDVVRRFDDPWVQLLDTRSLVVDKGNEAIAPDGIHFNVEGHRLVATMLVDVIQDWLARD
jgi:lysophospholipase L1-like esterase